MEFLDFHSYARLLNTLNSVRQGGQLHLLFLKTGVLFSVVSIANRLLQMYARFGRMEDGQKVFDEMPRRNCFTWNALLEGYAQSGGDKDSFLNLFHSMPRRDEFSWNMVLSGLIRFGDLDDARWMFYSMPRKNGTIAWNTMIHGYARSGESRTALLLFKEFLQWEVVESGGAYRWDPFILATVIAACADLGGVELGKQVHTRMVVDRVELDSVLGSTLVNMYMKCGYLDGAGRVLSSMENPDDYSLSSMISGYASFGRMSDAMKLFKLKSTPCVVLWNSMIAGYVLNNYLAEALMLFIDMHKAGLAGDYSTFSSVLSACSGIGIVKNCLQLHSFTYKSGILCDLVVASALVDAYAKCGSLIDACNLFSDIEAHDTVLLNSMITIYFSCGRIDEARCIFNDIKSKSLISWNAMIVGLSQNGYPAEALEIFCTMNQDGLRMDTFSLASAISACASIPLLEFGEQIFARAAVIGMDSHQIIGTSVIDLYCKSGSVELGRRMFNQMTEFDEISWNSMLMGYARNGYGAEALALFSEMRHKGVAPSSVTFTAILSACNHCGLVEEGKKWFYLMKQDYRIDPGIEHYSCMIDLFARAGCLLEAMDLIDRQVPDVNMWSSILRGCIQNGDKALSKKVAERIIERDPQNCDVLVQLSGAMASTGDWMESETVRQLMRDMQIRKSPGRSWCSL